MSALRVAVIGGGANVEHDVSLASAAGVAGALARAGHDVVRLTIGRDGGWHEPAGPLDLADAVSTLQGCDVAFPALHGPLGEDGTLAALCELAGLPYVGSPVGAGALAMDKWATKLVAQALGIATAPGRLVTADADAGTWGGPVVVKPVAAGSSHGVSLVSRAAELPAALDAALAVDSRVLVEQVVRGREIDVAVLGAPDGSHVVAPALEILGEGIFDLATKYDGSARFQVPAQVSASERRRLEECAVAMYRALGCAGVARVDFFLLADGTPVLNEVNTMPGFTQHSQVPLMFAAAGVTYEGLVDRLVREAVLSCRVRARPLVTS